MSTQPVSPATDLQQLSEVVARLSDALARSERRHAHFARAMRWGVAAMVALLFVGGLLITGRVGIAHADNPAGFPQATTAVEALNNINANLMVMGEVGKVLQAFAPAVKQAVMNNPDVQKYVQDYFKENNLNPSPEEQEAYATQAIVQSVVSTFVDTVVLLQRVRQDSNAFRELVMGPSDALHSLGHQLEVMNLAMASIPPMAAQMDLMNRNMSSMSYSMGSTMGRMGSWMPW